MVYDTMVDPFKLLKNDGRPPIPEDGKCQHCLVNELQYRWKMEKYVCGYCHSRLENTKYMNYTDAELDELRVSTLQNIESSRGYNKIVPKMRMMGDVE